METVPTTTGTELATKLERIRRLLDASGLDGILLRRTDNFAWATCGADSHINTADSIGIASLLITQKNHILVTNNIEATRLMQE